VFGSTLFDYNGVLVDDERVHWEAFRDVLDPLGIDLSEEQYWAQYLGFDDAGVFREVFAADGRPIDPARVAELIEAKRPCYLRRAKGTLRGFRGAADLVRQRAEVGPVVIVSGALRAEIELGLDVLGVREHIGAIIAAEDAPNSKPHPQGYLLGIEHLKRLGVSDPVHNGVVFEDSIDGIEAAVSAGLVCIAVGHTYPLDQLQATQAARVICQVGEITPELLSQVWQERQ
jgi:beta-phosphoglucomutase-like phosphatase (HAD superfamily)